jgi:hypothetical protein
LSYEIFTVDWCTFFLIVSGLLPPIFLLAIEIFDRKSSHIGFKGRLFWCRECGEFYLEGQNITVAACPRCSTSNPRLTF